MINKFQELLKLNNLDYYLLPTDDDHQSEEVGAHFQSRAYLSGFNGSAGTLLVMQNEAYLWTDGRYFIQAAQQLYDGITLMRSGQKDVPTLLEFLCTHIKDGDRIGFDGRTMNTQFILDLEDNLTVPYEIQMTDLMDSFWKERPSISCQKAYIYEKTYHGLDSLEKIRAIRETLQTKECTSHIIASLDDIAWIFNLRGHDTPCSPTALAFALITLDDAYLYLQDGSYDQAMVATYQKEHIEIRPYLQIYQDVQTLRGAVLLDPLMVNYQLFSCIQCDVVSSPNPSQLSKAIRNETEIKNTRQAHLKDGIAMTKFMYWLKNQYGKIPLDELNIAEKVTDFRKEQALFTDVSFQTICAFQENASLMHYHATPEHYKAVDESGFLLIDSGGQYLDGTTDVTRTYALGTLTQIQKDHFTMVLRGMLALQNAQFLAGIPGSNLDILARMPMWENGIDYQCGTGHGVGHFLNVHEGPQGIRPRARFASESCPIEAGMIVTDEPGIYLEKQYGIRIENELLCCKGIENEYGQFLYFEPLTLVPIDKDAINQDLLTYKEKQWLNDYHQTVYNKISPFLNSDEKAWLLTYTQAI